MLGWLEHETWGIPTGLERRVYTVASAPTRWWLGCVRVIKGICSYVVSFITPISMTGRETPKRFRLSIHSSLWLSTAVYSCLQQSMAVHSSLRLSTAVYGSPQQSTAVYSSLRLSTAVYGCLQQGEKSQRDFRLSTAVHGSPQQSTAVYGSL